MISFTQPIFLWTLAGITIPVAIHLLSRREGKVVKVGSLRHIEESNTSRFKSLRLNETLLLASRCLMIACIALFLAGAQCSSQQAGETEKWLLIEQGMHADKSVTKLIDSLSNEGYDLRTLNSNLPVYNPDDSVVQPDYWSIAEVLRKKTDHDIVVLSYSYAEGFTQKRPTTPANLTWINVEPQPREFIASARRISADSVMIRVGRTNSESTSYSNNIEASYPSRRYAMLASGRDSASIQQRDTLKISIVQDKIYTLDARVLTAALKTLASSFPIHLIQVPPQESEWIFLLTAIKASGTPVPGNVLRIAPQTSNELIRQVARNEWEITQRLTPESAVEAHLVTELGALLNQQQEAKQDARVMPERMSWAGAQLPLANSTEKVIMRDLSTILVLVFLVAWIIERTLALKRNL